MTTVRSLMSLMLLPPVLLARGTLPPVPLKGVGLLPRVARVFGRVRVARRAARSRGGARVTKECLDALAQTSGLAHVDVA